MKTPVWVIPAAIGTAAGLAVVVISRVPFERIGAPPMKMPPPALVPVQVPGPVVVAEAPPPKAPEFKIPSQPSPQQASQALQQQSAPAPSGLPQKKQERPEVAPVGDSGGNQNTHIADNLNAADMMFKDGLDGCPSVSLAILAANSPSTFGPSTSSQRQEVKRYAQRCNLRF
jgi:hypothetical protein